VPLKQDTVSAACPKCGHRQQESRAAYSSVCKMCHAHFRLAETLNPSPKPRPPAFEQKRVVCFDCGAELDVPVTAASTMCKWCSSYVDLGDYHITQTSAKNFRTHGRLIVEESGYVLNTQAIVGEAVIKGSVIGKITARRTLELHSTARIKGSFTAGRLLVPVGNHFRWPEILRVGGAEIAGELVAQLRSAGTVLLKSTARLFGDLQAGHLIIESGAVFVGAARIGKA
jgi:cytoskeletal protein CcmA (bactofilin family)/DNA-directed RNA polymerase subunit RPC12/RpoP